MTAAPNQSELHSFILNEAWRETNQIMEELSDQLEYVLHAVAKKFPVLTPTQMNRAEGAVQAILVCYKSHVLESAGYHPGAPEECDLFAEVIAQALVAEPFASP